MWDQKLRLTQYDLVIKRKVLGYFLDFLFSFFLSPHIQKGYKSKLWPGHQTSYRGPSEKAELDSHQCSSWGCGLLVFLLN